MTGFGRGHASTEDASATVEIQSTNKRHLNIFVHLPDPLPEAESDVRMQMKEAFERGQFDVNVSAELKGADTLPVDVDADAAMHHKRRLEQLAAAAQIEAPIRIDHLLEFEDIFAGEEEREAAKIQRAWPAVTQALDAAIDDLQALRREEADADRDHARDDQRSHHGVAGHESPPCRSSIRRSASTARRSRSSVASSPP